MLQTGVQCCCGIALTLLVVARLFVALRSAGVEQPVAIPITIALYGLCARSVFAGVARLSAQADKR